MTIPKQYSRRNIIKASAALTLASSTLSLQACKEANPDSVFANGVASGDPWSDRVILWTRITVPKTVKLSPGQLIKVNWEIALDEKFKNKVNKGSAYTSDQLDFTVKVDADQLAANQHYFYRFMVNDVVSPTGRTKTLPEGDVEQLKIAFTSCSHFSYGYFNVYARMAEQKDLDVVLHLGDYLYEYGNKDLYRNPFLVDRQHEPVHEMVTLRDYRLRHAQYKRDKDLQALHSTHPVICIWDDHEFANDTWRGGAENHTEGKEGSWKDRSAAAIRAYYEWMPIREPDSRWFTSNDREKAYRRFRFGNLMDLNILDTRFVGRSKHIDKFDGTAELLDDRSLLGFEQESWLETNLAQAQQQGVTWKLLGQQVQMMQIRTFGHYVNKDSWDGYQAARNRLLDFIGRESIDNVAILTGDVHSSWAAEITKDPYDFKKYNFFTSEGAQAVEFVTPSVTSPTIPVPGLQQLVGDAAKALQLENPHIKYIDFKNRGFVRLTITKEKMQADWFHVPVVGIPNKDLYLGWSMYVKAGQAKLHC